MPYKVVGKKLMHKLGKTWTLKQTAKSHDNAVKAMHLLQGIEHGLKPKKRKQK